eukprot:169877-Prorocentrum_minimum.AAC.2
MPSALGRVSSPPDSKPPSADLATSRNAQSEAAELRCHSARARRLCGAVRETGRVGSAPLSGSVSFFAARRARPRSSARASVPPRRFAPRARYTRTSCV